MYCNVCLVQTTLAIAEEWKAEFSKDNTTRGINHPNQFGLPSLGREELIHQRKICMYLGVYKNTKKDGRSLSD